MGVDVDGRRVLLLLVLLNIENLAVPVLVLQDMRVLLALQPRILEVEQPRLAPVLQQRLHLLSAARVAGVDVGGGRALGRVCPRLPFQIGDLGLIRDHLGSPRILQ